MSYLVDTCALSELTKPAPEPKVVALFDAVAADLLHVSALTLGEIRKGVERLPPGLRRADRRLAGDRASGLVRRAGPAH